MPLFGIQIAEWVQIGIATILLITAIFTYFNIKETKKNTKVKIFTNLVKEEREINKEINSYNLHLVKSVIKAEPKIRQAHELLFNFYEYIAILIFREEIDIELFYYYFNTRIIWIYDIFMNSKNIPDFDSRTENYPNLCGLFNSLDLSVKEIKG